MATRQARTKAVEEPPELLTRPEVCDILRIGVATLDRWISRGDFPRGDLVGPRRVWRKSVVTRWLDEHVAK